MERVRVGLLRGGRSAEHEVSLESARYVLGALDRERYEPVVIDIDKAGRWWFGGEGCVPLPASGGVLLGLESGFRLKLDVVFPVLHGPFGEDGTVQGLLKLSGVPFVGAGVLGSSVGMDKDAAKRLLRDAGLPVVRWLTVRAGREAPSFAEAAAALALPFFVKPANMGSSVGVSKVRSAGEYEAALRAAFAYDRTVLVEQFIEGREIECAVLEDRAQAAVRASVPGEVVPRHEFYSYDAKYLDEEGAALLIPAEIPPESAGRIQRLALSAFDALCCEGLARVDFFVRQEKGGAAEVFINEINTIPGFTKISMYPKLWEASGVPYPVLIDTLIKDALARFEQEQYLCTERSFS